MRIALYHPWVYLKSGLERSILELTNRSRHDWTIFTNHLGAGTYPELRQKHVVELGKVSVRRNYADVARATLRVLTQRVDLSAYDALVISSEGVGDFFVFRNHSLPLICYCLTPLKVIHDPYSKERYLQNNPRTRLKYAMFSTIFQAVDRLAWRYYDRVICISKETQARVLRAKLTPAHKISLIYPGIDVQRIEPAWNYGDYFLLPGRIMWQKNIELGIEAFQQYQTLHSGDKRLVIAGMVDEKSRSYYARLQMLAGKNSRIRFILDPTDEQLFALYRDAYSVLFTAMNEDWGIVPLEGMGFGKPVIAVNRGGPTESILNGETGYLVEPDPERFATAMAGLARDPQRVAELGRRARQHVLQFDWSQFVDQFDALIEDVVVNARPAPSIEGHYRKA